MGDAGSVDVIVVHYNRSDLTERCVRALADDDGALRTVTIVDSGSSPPLSDPYVSSWADLLRGTSQKRAAIELFVEVVGNNVGFAEANNRGLALRFEEGAEFFLVWNNDAYVSPSAPVTLSAWLGRLGPRWSFLRFTGLMSPLRWTDFQPHQDGAGYDRRSGVGRPAIVPWLRSRIGATRSTPVILRLRPATGPGRGPGQDSGRALGKTCRLPRCKHLAQGSASWPIVTARISCTQHASWRRTFESLATESWPVYVASPFDTGYDVGRSARSSWARRLRGTKSAGSPRVGPESAMFGF